MTYRIAGINFDGRVVMCIEIEITPHTAMKLARTKLLRNSDWIDYVRVLRCISGTFVDVAVYDYTNGYRPVFGGDKLDSVGWHHES